MLFSTHAAWQLLAPAEHCVETASKYLASAYCLPAPRCWGPGEKRISAGWFMVGAEDNPIGLFMISMVNSVMSYLHISYVSSRAATWSEPSPRSCCSLDRAEGLAVLCSVLPTQINHYDMSCLPTLVAHASQELLLQAQLPLPWPCPGLSILCHNCCQLPEGLSMPLVFSCLRKSSGNPCTPRSTALLQAGPAPQQLPSVTGTRSTLSWKNLLEVKRAMERSCPLDLTWILGLHQEQWAAPQEVQHALQSNHGRHTGVIHVSYSKLCYGHVLGHVSVSWGLFCHNCCFLWSNTAEQCWVAATSSSCSFQKFPSLRF